MRNERVDRNNVRQAWDNADGIRRVAITRRERRRGRKVREHVFYVVETSLISLAVCGVAALWTDDRDSNVEMNRVEVKKCQVSGGLADLIKPTEPIEWQNAGFLTDWEPAPLAIRDLSTVKVIPIALERVEAEAPVVEELVEVATPTDDEVAEEEALVEPFITGCVPREQFLEDRDAFSPRTVKEVRYEENERKAAGRIAQPVAEARRAPVNTNGCYVAF